ncbi:DUF885 family protein [Phytoactinopolyspora sp. XMNu-373]|uniref:DUF885 family protein n=1 Tax=Phytoactinopolyspora mesophila TaxID=2650750 RepID=A0A7K3M455_9ACTN|nr:DUF885 domain-containing protein [Phytoactinopolyspora mesophila]NDL58101.1 DUF885 family protein [Phytoactinopolyspora mesophila]
MSTSSTASSRSARTPLSQFRALLTKRRATPPHPLPDEYARAPRPAENAEPSLVEDESVQHTNTLTPRQLADQYVETLADLNPVVGAALGLRPGDDTMPDFSPAGSHTLADAQRATLAALDAAERADLPPEEERAARLLRERLSAELAIYDAGDTLCRVSNLFSPVQACRSVFLLMPTDTDADWSVIARRLGNVPAAVKSYRVSLDEGIAQGVLAATRQVETIVDQISTWIATDWFQDFVSTGPSSLRSELKAGADATTAAFAELRDYLVNTYTPAAEGTPDAVGQQRYLRSARYWTGSDLDLEATYRYGWQEYHRLRQEMYTVADAIMPGADPQTVMRHLNEYGEAVEGPEQIRIWLQQLMDDAIADLDGTHFDLADPIKRVESMIAPPGSAAAPYYSRPSLDFSRPGRTWLPTLGRERFPVWDLISTWYHEGVPGHHLQLAQWVHVQDRLSRYQVSVGSVSAATEGWALYAERLMDELGYLSDPAHRLGYLDAQMLRAVRVVIDIGMHVGMVIPADSGFHPGETWTPELAREFMSLNLGRDQKFIDSEIVRYLGLPGQAISYKLGERAWLTGREAARAARGADFDLKAWHMAALSMGALGLDDLATELARLP